MMDDWIKIFFSVVHSLVSEEVDLLRMNPVEVMQWNILNSGDLILCLRHSGSLHFATETIYCWFQGFYLLCYAWFAYYLENCCRKVKINDVFSEKMYVNVGVTQGYVLGSILLLIFVNLLFIQPLREK